MAYLGLSYALGELGSSDQAREASRQAAGLADGVTPRERTRIDVRVRQLAATAPPADPSSKGVYEKRLDEAVAEYPKDVELLLLRGQTEEPTHQGHGMGSGSSSLRFYERALAGRPDYFATHHYLTHAYENLDRLDRALDHAARFVQLAPTIAHAHHMHGHVLRRVDRMNDAIAEFRRADELEIAYLQREKIPPEYDWHYHHNLDLLGTSYEYVGQMRSAEATLRRSFDLPSIELSQELNERIWPMFLLARGRTEEALAASRALIGRRAPIVQALGHMLTSRVMVALGRTDSAVEEGDVALGQMRSIGPAGGVLVPELEVTQGEFLLRTGQAERGRVVLRQGVDKLRARPGPDAWIQMLFSLESEFRMARDVGEWTLASELAEDMRQYDPAYAGTHYALAQAADHRGDRALAQVELRSAIERWRFADSDLSDVADARRRLAALSARWPRWPRKH
jgi:tetratricopeptide (TPR) repeat protein